MLRTPELCVGFHAERVRWIRLAVTPTHGKQRAAAGIEERWVWRQAAVPLPPAARCSEGV